MIQPQQVYLAVDPLDMRWGLLRLSCHVQRVMGRSPCDGSAYGFTNRSHSCLKLLVWDCSGIWLCHRRLHRGTFYWPRPGAVSCRLTAAEWQWLVAGVAWIRVGQSQR